MGCSLHLTLMYAQNTAIVPNNIHRNTYYRLEIIGNYACKIIKTRVTSK